MLTRSFEVDAGDRRARRTRRPALQGGARRSRSRAATRSARPPLPRRGRATLHLVDLDGAFDGAPRPALLERLAAATGLPIQVGGGYRTLAAIATALSAGADRVMVGTAALDRAFLDRAVARFGEALVVAVDVRDGMVAASGWRETSATPAAEHAARCPAAGVARLLVTSTHRDGSLAGPDLDLLGSSSRSAPR